LDVQYYLFHDDETGRALLSELIDAADRGVRIRLLLDDIHTGGQDETLAAMDAHPHIEVRLFNPFAHRSARWLDLIGDYRRVNRRMHNKSITADNQLTIVGGRNIGDEYFAVPNKIDFSDLDLLAAGPIVPEVSAAFDGYWSSAVVFPIASLHSREPSEAVMRRLRDELRASYEALRRTSYAQELATTDLAQSLRDGRLESFWGEASVIVDRPEKVTLPTKDQSTHAGPKLRAVIDSAREELLLVSPYFVPRNNGVRWLAEIAERGVRVRVITNSCLATDVGVVHASYAKYRKKLLRAGVEIYELKPSAGAVRASPSSGAQGSSRASLHAKTYIIDRRQIFVGSLNLDPRSVSLNTEMGIVVRSEPLCAQFHDSLERALLDLAYRVEIDRSGSLSWLTRESGQEVRVEGEPGVGAFRKVVLFLEGLLPVEAQL
jgi:cardiolipin synthase C